MSVKRYANIMVLGYTGVGKSSLINYLVGKEVSKACEGSPITQGFDTYEVDDGAGIPLRIFDSKGLEVKDYDKIEKDIISFVQGRCGSEAVYEWIHSIFYCINAKSDRIQPKEIEFVKKLSGKISQSIHVILTHCDLSAERKAKEKELIKYVKAQLRDEKIQIFCVNSVESKKRVGITPAFGRDEILGSIFKTLWSDIANKISKEYAKELHGGLENIVRGTVFVACNRAEKKISSRRLISDLIHDREDTMNQVEEAFDTCMKECDQMEEELEEKCHAKITPLVEFCNEYGKSMGYEIEFYSFSNFLPDDFMEIDIDEIMERSKLGKAMREIEDMDSAEGFQLLFQAGKAVVTLLSMKKLVKECLGRCKFEINQNIPSCKVLEKSIYDNLMRGFH